MFLGHAIVGLDPTDNFPHLLRSIPAEIDDENAIIRKKIGVPVKSFFHPGSGNVVNGFPEADDVILLSGHIGLNIGPYVLVFAGASILRASGTSRVCGGGIYADCPALVIATGCSSQYRNMKIPAMKARYPVRYPIAGSVHASWTAVCRRCMTTHYTL